MLANKLITAVSGGEEKLFVDDVFSAFTYTGNGGTQTINNGIDLAGKGGLVWIKNRNTTNSNTLLDSARGIAKYLFTDTTGAQGNAPGWIDSFNTNGFTAGAAGGTYSTAAGNNYVSWTFRRAPKFFDVVTWTGDGANRTIAHSLGSVPGMVVVKRTDVASEWKVYHNSIANTAYLALNTTAASATDTTLWNSATATPNVFSLGTNAAVNANAATYVAYLFAHDTSADGLIQCGSYTGTLPSVSVNLGWEPQFLLTKNITTSTADWNIVDASRAITSNSLHLHPNTSNGEGGGLPMSLQANGFTISVNSEGYNTSGSTYIYLAIRRPNKPPTLGTQVYNAITYSGNGATNRSFNSIGFAPDFVNIQGRDGAGIGRCVSDRVRGGESMLETHSTAVTYNSLSGWMAFDLMDGFCLPTSYTFSNNAAYTYIAQCFRRAPGFFDEVCYTGTGVAKTEAHSLGVAPELIIVKDRTTAQNWPVYCAYLGGNPANRFVSLNLVNSFGGTPVYWNDTMPTASVFTVGTTASTNTASDNYVAYLFATLPGISKVFSYTGNGTSQTIACGFTTGARFVLIKRTDAAGDWYVWDTVRGIVAANDPHLSLNTPAVEVTTNDSVDPTAVGFIVNQDAATNINVTSATYIGLAIS